MLSLLEITRASFGCGESKWQFSLSKEDYRLCKGKVSRVGFVRNRDMFKFLPFTTPLQKTLFNMTISSSRPLLADRTVFILMLLIVMLNDKQYSAAILLKEQYWTKEVAGNEDVQFS